MLPEPPLPLPPQDADLLLEVNALQVNSSPSMTPNVPSPQADPTAQSARPPSKLCAVLTTQKNSFGLFHVYDEESIPNANDPEDQSRAGPLLALNFANFSCGKFLVSRLVGFSAPSMKNSPTFPFATDLWIPW